MHEERIPKVWFGITSTANHIMMYLDEIVHCDAASALMERDEDSLNKIHHHLNTMLWDMQNSIREHNKAMWEKEE